MSRLSPNLRPMMLLSNHSSSSLDGMEIASRRSSVRTQSSRGTASYHKVKPLPPTPTLRVPSPGSSRASSTISSRRPSFASSRKYSTTSSIYTEDVPPPSEYLAFRKDTLLPSAWFESDSNKDRSTALERPDALLSGPETPKNGKGLPILSKPAATHKGSPESLFIEWNAPKYRGSDDDENYDYDSDNNDQTRAALPAKDSAWSSREVQHIAEQHANDYMSVLARASTMPSTEYEPYHEGYNSLPSETSPRVTDVVDETLVPRPLRKSTALDSSTSSHFSDSSGYMALKEEYTDSFKSSVKKAFHSHKLSQDKAIKKHTSSHSASAVSDTGDRNQIMSMTPSERASIQRGIIDMYDSLTTLYDPLKQHAPPPEAKPRMEIALPDRNIVQKDVQSLAIPLTPFHKGESKAWDSVPLTMPAHENWFPASPTGSTPKKSHFSLSSQDSPCTDSRSSLPLAEKAKKIKTYSLPQAEKRSKADRSVGGKLKKAVGLESKKSKQAEDEKRREDMKKKIVIVETIEHGPFLVGQ